MRQAKAMTLEVQRRAARILAPGIKASDVRHFIDSAHRQLGADGGSYFCAVQFAEASSYPHGVPGDQSLSEGDVVLIDTGCQVGGYHSDITVPMFSAKRRPRSSACGALKKVRSERPSTPFGRESRASRSTSPRDSSRAQRLWSGLPLAGSAAPDRAWNRSQHPRAALFGTRRHDALAAGHVLQR